MIDMRNDSEDKKNLLGEDSSVPTYPYGLEISLSGEQMKRLGFQDPPKVDEKMKLKAEVYVSNVNAEAENGDTKEYSMRLQITDMVLGRTEEKEIDNSPNKVAASVMYGE